eukprot:s3436_g6.t1
MPRPKKAVQPVPPMDPTVVHGFLAKARAMVESVGGKRKSSDDTSALAPPPPPTKAKGSAPPPTKAKGSAPPPSKCTPGVSPACPVTSKVSPPPAPATRVRGKSPEGVVLPATKPKALSLTPVPPKGPQNSGPASSSGISAFERTRQALLDAKTTREATEGKAAAVAVKAIANTVKPKETEPEHAAGDDKTPSSEVPMDVVDVETPDAKPAQPVPPNAMDVLATPPPKANQFASPKGSPDGVGSDVATTVGGSSRSLSDEFDDDDPRWLQGHSQRSYYGSRGESWWSGGADWYPAHYCYYWDHNRNRGVYAWGDQSWTYKSPEWKEHGSWEGKDETPSPDAPALPDEGDNVRGVLNSRLPTTSFSPDEASPDASTPGEAHSEVPAPSEAVGTGEDGAPAAPEGKTWRTDKHGNPLNPAALYMRFYRQIRSTKNPVPEEVQEKRVEAEMGALEPRLSRQRRPLEVQVLGGSQAYKGALTADLTAASKNLQKAKDVAVSALAKQADFDQPLKDLQLNSDLTHELNVYKKVAGTVNGHLKPKVAAKAKGKAKAAAKAAAP